MHRKGERTKDTMLHGNKNKNVLIKQINSNRQPAYAHAFCVLGGGFGVFSVLILWSHLFTPLSENYFQFN